METDTKMELTEVELMELPMHELRSMMKKQGLKYSPKNKKVELAAMLSTGIQKQEKKPEPRKLENKPNAFKVKPVLPSSAIQLCQDLGVHYTICEESCSATFRGDIPVCCNLDQSEKNILNSIRQTRALSKPRETRSTRGSFV